MIVVPRRPAGPRGRAGFTLLEVLLALSIGAMTIASGFALVSYTERLNGHFAQRLEQSARLAFVQRTISRSLQSIVAAPDGFDPQDAANAAAEAAERARFGTDTEAYTDAVEAERQREREGLTPEEIAASTEDTRRPRRAPPARPRFQIGHVSNRGEWEDRGDRAGRGLRRMEVVLSRPPFGDRGRGAPVRGALDLVPVPAAEGERWRLQWTPIRPAGPPTILLEDLELAEWSVTDSRGQFDRFEAFEASDLPWAVRTIFWTEAGVRVDWMFDLGSASTSGDPL